MKFLALVLAACSIDYTPNVGPILDTPEDAQGAGSSDGGSTPSATGCTNADSDPTVSVSFANDVRPLMLRSPGGCSPCHLGRVTSGLDLSSYQSLRRGGINSGARIIVPAQPCDSILPQKLSRTPPFGSRMPYNGPPYFSATELQLVRDWIAEGALDN
jgi:hypothetical protein